MSSILTGFVRFIKDLATGATMHDVIMWVCVIGLVMVVFCDAHGVLGVVLSIFRACVIHFDRICAVHQKSCDGCDDA